MEQAMLDALLPLLVALASAAVVYGALLFLAEHVIPDRILSPAMVTYAMRLVRLPWGLVESAAAVGIVLGFAAQKAIEMLFARIQTALTPPIRADDVVIVEGEWGSIEEITLTYVVVKIWDLRCLVREGLIDSRRSGVKPDCPGLTQPVRACCSSSPCAGAPNALLRKVRVFRVLIS